MDDAAAPPPGGLGGGNPDSIFQMASNATSEDQAEVRRTITMVRFYSFLLLVFCIPSTSAAGGRMQSERELTSGWKSSFLS